MSQNALYSQDFTLTSGQCDLSNRALLRFFADCFQEAARNHAEALGLGVEHLAEAQKHWALTRILVTIDHIPERGETVTVNTWPKGMEGVFAFRDFEMKSGDGQMLARATSSWVVVDAETKRILPPPKDFELMFALKDRHALTTLPEKIETQLPEMDLHVRKIRYSDLDLIAHVNNARYLDFITDVIAENREGRFEPAGYCINFLKEIKLGDTLSIHLLKSNTENRHTVTGVRQGGVLCFTAWVEVR